MAHELGTVPFEQNGGEGIRVDAAPDAETLRANKLTYFGNRLCPFAHRAWWAMHEKGVADQFTYYHVDLGDAKPVWFQHSINPLGTVPCIYDSADGVFESAICVEYLEDKFPGQGTQIMPSDPVQRARVRLFVSQLGFAPFYAFMMEQERDKDAGHVAACDEALGILEKRYSEAHESGPFFLGEHLSAADVAVFPFLDRFLAGLHVHRGYAMSLPQRLAAAFAAVQQRPAWRCTSQPPAFYVSAYEGYASGLRTVPKRVKAVSHEIKSFAAVKTD